MERGRKPRPNYTEVENAAYAVMRGYVAGARTRGLEFLLTEKEFRDLITSPCHYTGSLPDKPKLMRSGKVFYYLGIDRKDSSKGYTPENCVPCCSFANLAKRARPYEEFIEWLKQVAIFWKDK